MSNDMICTIFVYTYNSSINRVVAEMFKVLNSLDNAIYNVEHNIDDILEILEIKIISGFPGLAPFKIEKAYSIEDIDNLLKEKKNGGNN